MTRPTKRLPWIPLAGIGTGLAAVALSGCRPPDPWAGVTPASFARVNEHRIRGVGLLEMDKTAEAAAEFVAIQKERPNLAFGYMNEAACYVRDMARSEAALPDVRKGIELLPKAGWPHLIEAALLRNSGKNEQATKTLEKAVRKEPQNPRVVAALVRHLRDLPGDQSARLYDLRKQLAGLAAGNLVAHIEWLQAQAERKEWPGARDSLEKIRALLPRMSADAQEYYNQASSLLTSGGDPDTQIRSFTNLMAAQPQYTPAQNELYGGTQDPAIWLMREWGTPPPVLPAPPVPPVTITWKDVTQAAGLAGVTATGTAPIGVGDVDLWPEAGRRNGATVNRVQDRPDLVLGAAVQAPLINSGAGFSPAPPKPPEASPLAADFNNDFTLDFYVAAPGGDFLMRSALEGNTRKDPVTFTRLPKPPAREPMPGRGPGSATAVDLDQDGDLDIVRASADPAQPGIRYLRNNGDWSFTDLTAGSGLKLPSAGARQAVYGDFDRDLDPDLFVVQAGGGCRLFLNQRQDVFKDGTEAWGIQGDAGALSAAVADPDRDGDWDLVVVGGSPHGAVFYRNTGARFEADPAALPLPLDFGPQWVEWADYDNDSWLDLVVAGQGGVVLLRNDHGKLTAGEKPVGETARWATTLDYDLDGDLDVLAVTGQNRVKLLSNEGGNARPWIRWELLGYVAEPGQATQANNSYGIGTEAEVRTVWGDQPVLMTRPVMHLGLAPAERAVAVRVRWTHGVPQDAIAPEPNAPLHFAQVPGGSCPYLYAWDGTGWRFITDFNWRSPLGMLAARGKPVPHDLTLDWDKIRGEWLQPIGGFYRLIATEELREVSYFDWMQLAAVDHPADTEIYVDERFPFGPPQPFRIYTTRQERVPAAARNEAGEDLLPALRKTDNVYTPVPPGPLRGVTAPHDLILDLGPVRDPKNVQLFLHGWIYPQPNSTNVALGQNTSLPVIPPTLYVGDGRGGWTGEDRTIGLPCGKRKTIVLDLSHRFINGDYRIKLTTTSEIRWDRAFFTSGEAPVAVRRHEIPLLETELRERGVGPIYREAPDGPDLRRYEGATMPEWPNIAGAYTRLGECSPLLRQVDDQYAIIAPGDELRMLFDGRKLPPPPAGWKRDYLFLSDGWTKDTDANTVSGETVAPLPFHGMKRYPYGPDERFPDTPAHRRWAREWNTRIKAR